MGKDGKVTTSLPLTSIFCARAERGEEVGGGRGREEESKHTCKEVVGRHLQVGLRHPEGLWSKNQ